MLQKTQKWELINVHCFCVWEKYNTKKSSTCDVIITLKLFFYEMTLNHSIKAHKERTPANKSMPYVSVNLTRTLTELMLVL